MREKSMLSDRDIPKIHYTGFWVCLGPQYKIFLAFFKVQSGILYIYIISGTFHSLKELWKFMWEDFLDWWGVKKFNLKRENEPQIYRREGKLDKMRDELTAGLFDGDFLQETVQNFFANSKWFQENWGLPSQDRKTCKRRWEVCCSRTNRKAHQNLSSFSSCYRCEISLYKFCASACD